MICTFRKECNKKMKKDDHKMKNDNFLEACHNAVNGIIYAATTQRNIRIQLVLAVIVMLFIFSLWIRNNRIFVFSICCIFSNICRNDKHSNRNSSRFICGCISSKS